MIEKSEVEDAHYRVHEHVRFLHAYWYMFRQIFRAPREKQRLLGKVVPQFFVLLEKSLIRTVFLEFRLLTEKPVTMGRRNASLPGLLDAVYGPSWEGTDAAEKVNRIVANSTVRQHVNRVIAHIDWKVAAAVEEPPGAVELEEVEDALGEVRSVMRVLAQELGLPELDYTGARIDAEVDRLFEMLATASN